MGEVFWSQACSGQGVGHMKRCHGDLKSHCPGGETKAAQARR